MYFFSFILFVPLFSSRVFSNNWGRGFELACDWALVGGYQERKKRGIPQNLGVLTSLFCGPSFSMDCTGVNLDEELLRQSFKTYMHIVQLHGIRPPLVPFWVILSSPYQCRPNRGFVLVLLYILKPLTIITTG